MNRTAIALLLTIGAIAVPCAAWYVSASREVERQVADLLARPQRDAIEAAEQLARQLAERLETLRQNEMTRPFFHYGNLYHDPRGAYEGKNAAIPSPLADGPRDGFVAAHFQINEHGRVTLPTINEDIPELNTTNDLPNQRLILNELQPAAIACAAAFVNDGQVLPEWGMQLAQGQQRAAPNQPANQQEQQTDDPHPQQKKIVPQQRGASNQSNEQQAQSFEGYAVAQQELKKQPPTKTSQIQKLKPDVWSQQMLANTFYAKTKMQRSARSPSNYKVPMKGDVVIKIGDLRWRTVPISDKPTLVSMRQVTTPAGVWLQGFTVSTEQASSWLNNRKGATLPAKLISGKPKNDPAAIVPIGGSDWHIQVDPTPATVASAGQIATIRSRFVWQFTIGAIAAALAGACVVGLVWQSDRLARHRAQFAASAAHELRTPLAGLRMYGEMLADGLGNPENSGDYARRISDEAERLGRVVTNVLGFTRLERGTLSVNPHSGDIATTVLDCVNRQRPRIEAAGATIDLDIDDDLPNVKFDSDAIYQIVHNLIDNAEKYSRDCNDRSIQIQLRRASNGVSLTVSDHGPGVTGELRRKLFRPFTRGSDPDAPAGLGLGLALTQGLAKGQNAKISYSDTLESSGATFSIVFPAD